MCRTRSSGFVSDAVAEGAAVALGCVDKDCRTCVGRAGIFSRRAQAHADVAAFRSRSVTPGRSTLTHAGDTPIRYEERRRGEVERTFAKPERAAELLDARASPHVDRQPPDGGRSGRPAPATGAAIGSDARRP